ncbi:hypothetical protein BAY61_22670 [Prauserella marina]|nr:hypothetical protein BAY61_22670 [Prauserella marina]
MIEIVGELPSLFTRPASRATARSLCQRNEVVQVGVTCVTNDDPVVVTVPISLDSTALVIDANILPLLAQCDLTCVAPLPLTDPMRPIISVIAVAGVLLGDNELPQ